MDTYRRFVSVMVLMFAVTTLSANDILVNSSCDWTVNGEGIPIWTQALGTTWTPRASNPDPQHGSAYFFAGATANAELRQDIDLSSAADSIDAGVQSVMFYGWFRSFNQSPRDTAFAILEFWNSDLTSLLWSDSTAKYYQQDAWLQDSLGGIVPADARWVRLRLRAKRGSGTNNDGYFDNLSLIANPPIIYGPRDLMIRSDSLDAILYWRGSWDIYDVFSDTLDPGAFETLEGTTNDETFRDTLGIDRNLKYYKVVGRNGGE